MKRVDIHTVTKSLVFFPFEGLIQKGIHVIAVIIRIFQPIAIFKKYIPAFPSLVLLPIFFHPSPKKPKVLGHQISQWWIEKVPHTISIGKELIT